jgi:hypothetical protein
MFVLRAEIMQGVVYVSGALQNTGTFSYKKTAVSGALKALPYTELLSLWLERHGNILFATYTIHVL